MSMRTDRRRFLRRVRRGRRAGGPGRPGLPVEAPAGLGRRGEAGPEGRPAPAGDRAAGPAAGGHPARAAARGGRRADQEGAELPGSAGGAPAGRRAEHPAAAGRVQVPRGAGGQLGAPGQPGLARLRPLAADLLGARPLQGLAGPRRQARGTGRWPRWTRRPCRRRAGREAFIAAMDRWDEAAADAAVAGLARTAGSNEIYELFVRYGARDFRDIGHKAIYVANSWRTLQCIGWQHAEPVLRSLAYALLQHGKGNPADQDDPADRPGRRNQALRGADPRGLVRRQARRPGRGRPALDPAHRLRRRRQPAGRRAPEPRRRAAVDLGRPVRRRRRAAPAPAGDRRAARGDHDQRDALRLPGHRRRPDPPAADAPERRVPHPVPRGAGRPRQDERGADRSARAGRDLEGQGLHRGRSRRSSPRPAATRWPRRAGRWPTSRPGTSPSP